MVCWGRGLLQSDDDYDIAHDLDSMFGCNLSRAGDVGDTDADDRAATVQKLNDGLLSQKFDKILSADFRPPTSYHARSRVAVVLGLLAMQLGAVFETRHLDALKVLRRFLPTLEQQLQLVTALAEYKNDGTPWRLGSKDLDETMAARAIGVTDYDLGDEFWYSGLGHSADENPTSDTLSKTCLDCGAKPANLLRCGRCKMARYCNASCQSFDWIIHKKVCYARDEVRSCLTHGVDQPVPHADQLQEVKVEGLISSG
ncbi:hypothetical protein F4779DRAFT_640867 [Xylariaceae sp. FL0662B]|nr:hypothetical protein F4779DRAFT_640867 [Xylariaceae sp. FL0662B]